MARDVIITPASGQIDFQDSGVSKALVQVDSSGNMSISNGGGNLSVGNTASDVYIGDGINNVDLIFELSGTIRPGSGQTLSLGLTGGNNVAITTGITATNGWKGTGSGASVLGGIPMAFTCERGSVGSVTPLAFGNGSDTRGARMPFAGKVVYATLECSDLNGTFTVVLIKNEVQQTQYTLSAISSGTSVGTSANWISSPSTFAAGDTLNFVQTVVPTGARGNVVTFFVVFD